MLAAPLSKALDLIEKTLLGYLPEKFRAHPDKFGPLQMSESENKARLAVLQLRDVRKLITKREED